MRRPWKFYSLTRPKLRQSWNKYNLYNIARATGAEPQVKGRATFFQQKWAAKAKTRGYHGEHVSEKKWVRLFSRRLLSAVDLPPEYLAANDGSEQAAGRGSGLSTSNLTAETYSRVPRTSSLKRRQPSHFSQRREGGFGDVNSMLSKEHENMTPYMQMTFAPLERRLDTAVFRAMFASSVRQARQFVIHGAVKVNGKKMVHPSYALNPGDMFQVDIEKVLYGTGEQKMGDPYASDKSAARAAKKRDDATVARYRQLQAEKSGVVAKEGSAEEEVAEEKEAEGEEGAENEAAASEDNAWEDLEDEYKQKVQLSRLGQLRELARDVLEGDSRNLTAKQKKSLRAFRDSVKRFLSLPENKRLDARELLRQLQDQIDDLSSKVPAFEKAVPAEEDGAKEVEEKEETAEQKKRREFKERVLAKGLDGITDPNEIAWAKKIMKRTDLSKDELRNLTMILRNDLENPVDESKSYLTPWRPKPFMSAFAFIPRYLEVNPNICAAVYLRHPVARKGIAEVPTPFGYLTSQLAHNWYLGRG